MKERDLVKRIRRELEAAGAKTLKVHGSPYMPTGTPDILACWRGVCLVIECKVNDNKPSQAQLHELRAWGGAGAQALVADESFEATAFLKALQRQLTGSFGLRKDRA